MPTYEYHCPDCGHDCEIFQSIKARPIKKCPSCGERSMQRLIGSGAGIIFRGSGFYETDYRSESYKNGQRKDTSAASASKADASAKGKESSSKSTAKKSADSKNKQMKAAG